MPYAPKVETTGNNNNNNNNFSPFPAILDSGYMYGEREPKNNTFREHTVTAVPYTYFCCWIVYLCPSSHSRHTFE
jgi:hypothetical protein